MSSRSVCFLLALDPTYARMATALVRSLTVFHPGSPIVVRTLDEHLDTLKSWVRAHAFRDVSIVPFRPAVELSFGEWHPLVWAKLEAFASDPDIVHVVLDVDQIMYRDFSACIDEAAKSSKTISASPDISDLRSHLLDSFDGALDLTTSAKVRCFNAGAMIVRPSGSAYIELIELAERHHRDVRLPEQAILNLWARENEEYHNLGDKFMIEPWSPKLLETPIPSCLVHFWTPRPAFFGANPVRSAEPRWDACLTAFRDATGVPYPLKRFERDFRTRLRGSLQIGRDA
ncbi:MAG: hypothetical protein ACRCXL_15775 [Dermatophilaceae bacterium]